MIKIAYCLLGFWLSISSGCFAGNNELLELLKSRSQNNFQVAPNRNKHVPQELRFFKSHSLLFFFSSTCPYCQAQAKSLKTWAEDNHVTIEAISFDDKGLPEFPDFKTPTSSLISVAYQGKPMRFPAIFIMNQNTNALYPVAFGALEPFELAERINELTSKINSYERGRL